MFLASSGLNKKKYRNIWIFLVSVFYRWNNISALFLAPGEMPTELTSSFTKNKENNLKNLGMPGKCFSHPGVGEGD